MKSLNQVPERSVKGASAATMPEPLADQQITPLNTFLSLKPRNLIRKPETWHVSKALSTSIRGAAGEASSPGMANNFALTPRQVQSLSKIKGKLLFKDFYTSQLWQIGPPPGPGSPDEPDFMFCFSLSLSNENRKHVRHRAGDYSAEDTEPQIATATLTTQARFRCANVKNSSLPSPEQALIRVHREKRRAIFFPTLKIP